MTLLTLMAIMGGDETGRIWVPLFPRSNNIDHCQSLCYHDSSIPFVQTYKNMEEFDNKKIEEANDEQPLDRGDTSPVYRFSTSEDGNLTPLSALYRTGCVVLLLLSYFLSQYDK